MWKVCIVQPRYRVHDFDTLNFQSLSHAISKLSSQATHQGPNQNFTTNLHCNIFSACFELTSLSASCHQNILE
jgi:hypothetical protein